MRILSLLLALFLLPCAALAQSSICYLVADATAGGPNDRLTSFDRTTSTEVDYGGVGTTRVEAIAFHPVFQRIYVANEGTFGYFDNFTPGSPNPLNPPFFQAIGTGFGSSSNGSRGLVTFNDVDGLMFDPETGELYGSLRRAPADSVDILIKVDTTTGTFVANAFDTDGNGSGDADYVPISGVLSDAGNSSSVTLNDIDDLAFVYNEGSGTSTLYAVANNGTGLPSRNILVTIDKNTGAATRVNPVGSSQLTIGDVEGLTADSQGNLYGVTGDNARDEAGNPVTADQNQFLVLGADGSVTSQTGLGVFALVLTDYEAVACLLDPVGVIPVELTSFDVQLDGRAAQLAWATATETNNAGFEVQHFSPAEGAWNALGFVEGAQTTLEAQSYTFAIDALEPGTHRFRLKQIDFDGVFEYSPEVEVVVELAETFHLSEAYPNPFNPSTRFTLQLRHDERVSVAVYDVVGRHVRTLFEGSLSANTPHAFELDASSLSSGTYFIRVIGERFSTAQRVVLLK